jgi:hypothetical protein
MAPTVTNGAQTRGARRWLSRITGAAALALVIHPATAESINFGPDLAGQGWKILTFRSLTPVNYAAEGADRLTIRADKASSLIWRGLDENLWPKRTARWRWRVQTGVAPTDLSIKGSDDRSIALYFVFARDEAAARSAKGSASLSSAMWWSSGSALVYVWGGNAARGSIVASPHMGSSGKLVIRQPAGASDGKWLPEQADLMADFRRAFGRAPGPLVGLAISSDSDDTGGLNVAAIEGLQLD